VRLSSWSATRFSRWAVGMTTEGDVPSSGHRRRNRGPSASVHAPNWQHFRRGAVPAGRDDSSKPCGGSEHRRGRRGRGPRSRGRWVVSTTSVVTSTGHENGLRRGLVTERGLATDIDEHLETCLFERLDDIFNTMATEPERRASWELNLTPDRSETRRITIRTPSGPSLSPESVVRSQSWPGF
jgi:hypothetical protein